MTAVRPEGRYQAGGEGHGGGQYDPGQYGAQPYAGGGAYGGEGAYGGPYGAGHARGGYQGDQARQGGHGGHSGHGGGDEPLPDGWGVYEPYGSAPGETRGEPSGVLPGEIQGVPEYPWLADQTLQLRTIPQQGADPAPPAGGRAERRRAAQGRPSVRSGSGRRRASGRGAEARVRPRESVGVVAARLTGELCITLGLVMLLFVSYQLWWTNVQADQAAGDARNQLEQQFQAVGQQPAPGQPQPDASKAPEAFAPGKGFAIIHLPKLGLTFPIAEGTSKPNVLDKGLVGHYTGTAMPGDKSGNFALAAHRNTHGEPFRHINQLSKGDKVVVETATSYFTYEITGGIPETPPSNVSVIQPIPKGSGYTQAGKYITLTTCTPEFSSKARLILFGKMVEERPRSQGKPTALGGN
ncbi:class E sortase [Kitasatospora sp. NPDC050543]|uniref:class E sortase n=1 Tax=Kitasatospora sp. NPDC050543 TaxID=3364054 RepID=UPI0037B573B8